MQVLPKIKTGIQGLDEITFGGFPKGRPTLICGGPGCGKTLMAIEFIDWAGNCWSVSGVQVGETAVALIDFQIPPFTVAA